MRAAPLALALALLVPLVPLAAPEAAPAPGVHDLVLDVSGEPAHGLVAFPDGAPTALVVVMHGYGHKAESHREHLRVLAEEHGAAAVAMDFRGTGFALRAGADDTMAATEHLMALYPGADVPIILYSVSMGTAAASMALAELAVFDYWVDNEGLAMLHETWAGASLLAPANAYAANAKADIEAECGGTPADDAACYLERSAALRGGEYAYLRGAVLTHGLHDGLVPYDQGREMATALRAAGVPVAFHTVARGEPGGEGTTLTGYGGHQVDGLAGHGTESDDTHTLTALSFGLLYALVDGAYAVDDGETLHDRELSALLG